MFDAQRIGSTIVFLLVLGPATAGAQTTITFFHTDGQGSPVAASDEVGNLLWRESYTPYGSRTLNPAQAAGQRLWYTGHVQDADTDLVYASARYYEPEIGRFLRLDPASVVEGDVHSFNRYAYAANSPFNHVDRDGRRPIEFTHWEVRATPLLAMLIQRRLQQMEPKSYPDLAHQIIHRVDIPHLLGKDASGRYTIFSPNNIEVEGKRVTYSHTIHDDGREETYGNYERYVETIAHELLHLNDSLHNQIAIVSEFNGRHEEIYKDSKEHAKRFVKQYPLETLMKEIRDLGQDMDVGESFGTIDHWRNPKYPKE